MTRRLTILLFTAGAAALALSTIMAKPAKYYVWNASGSVPVGLYRLQPTGDLVVTQLVAVQPSEPLATFLSERGYLPRGVPMLKRVLALPGQIVCRDGLAISVDNIALGEDACGRMNTVDNFVVDRGAKYGGKAVVALECGDGVQLIHLGCCNLL